MRLRGNQILAPENVFFVWPRASEKKVVRGDNRAVEETRRRRRSAGQVSRDVEARAIGTWKEGDNGGDGKQDDEASALEVRRNKKEGQASCETWARAMGEWDMCEGGPGKHDDKDEVRSEEKKTAQVGQGHGKFRERAEARAEAREAKTLSDKRGARKKKGV